MSTSAAVSLASVYPPSMVGGSLAASSVLFKDTFTGVNGTLLTAHVPDVGTSWTAADGTAVIQSNTLQSLTEGTFGTVVKANYSSPPNDYKVTVTELPETGGAFSGPIGRYLDVNNFVFVNNAAGSAIQLNVRNGGSESTLVGSVTSIALPNTITMHCWGAVITVLANGVLVTCGATDLFKNAVGNGIRMAAGVAGTHWDNYQVDTIITPAAVNTTFAAGTGIIFDTDFGTDQDDAQALQIIHSQVKVGQCTLLCCVTSTYNADSVNAIYGMNTYYGRSGIPVGLTLNNTITAVGAWTTTMATTYGGAGPGLTALDAVKVMRTALAGAANGSVRGITVGYSTNLAALLASAANYGGDGFPSGIALVTAKCLSWTMMGGVFGYASDNSVLPAIEFNYSGNPTALVSLFAAFPATVPLYLHGYEIGTAAPLNTTTVIISANRPSWDPSATTFGILGGTFGAVVYWNSVSGTAYPISNGACGFIPGAGNHWVCKPVAAPAVATAAMKIFVETAP